MILLKIFYRYFEWLHFFNSNVIDITLIFGNNMFPNFNITNSIAMKIFGRKLCLHFRSFPSVESQKQHFGSEDYKYHKYLKGSHILPGKSHGRRSLVGCSPWDHEESDTTERLHFHFSLSCIGEGNGNPLQCSCLQNPRDRRARWAAISGVAQSRTRLKRLSSSSRSSSSRSSSRIKPVWH